MPPGHHTTPSGCQSHPVFLSADRFCFLVGHSVKSGLGVVLIRSWARNLASTILALLDQRNTQDIEETNPDQKGEKNKDLQNLTLILNWVLYNGFEFDQMKFEHKCRAQTSPRSLKSGVWSKRLQLFYLLELI